MSKEFNTEDIIKITSSMAAEAVELLPEGMKEMAATAFQAVILSHGGEWKRSQDKLRKLRGEAYSSEPFSEYLSAVNEFHLYESLPGDDPMQRKHVVSARPHLRKYLSSDLSHRDEVEILHAELMKARADYILFQRKGIFMCIVDLPENADVKEENMLSLAKIKGLKTISSTETSVMLRHGNGAVLSASLEEPGLMVVACTALTDDLMESASYFIRLASSVMSQFKAESVYINSVMLSADDVVEAVSDLKENAFPVWFFARCYDSQEEDGIMLTAEGAESFGCKAVSIRGLSPEEKEEAGNALSLILVYNVYSPSSRRSRSFSINGRTYRLVSSDSASLVFALER